MSNKREQLHTFAALSYSEKWLMEILKPINISLKQETLQNQTSLASLEQGWDKHLLNKK